MALAIAALNAVLPPLLAALRLPFTVALGFVLVLVLNAVVLKVGSDLVDGTYVVDSFGWALLAALVVAAVSVVLEVIFGTNDDDTYTLKVIQRIARQAGRRGTNRPAWNHLPRDRRTGSPGAPQGHARRERADDGTLARREDSSPRRSGKPTSRRRRVRARPGSCSARTTTSPRSGGSRRRPGRS